MKYSFRSNSKVVLSTCDTYFQGSPRDNSIYDHYGRDAEVIRLES